MDRPLRQQEAIPFWRDERVLQVIGQIVFAAAVVGAGAFLLRNMFNGLARIGLPISFRFLTITSGFDIGESLIRYARSDTYLRAFLVGLLNTLQVAALGIFFATILGVGVGVARLSTNWLVNRLAAVYIEVLRNIPLLVLLIFWYRGLFLTMPGVREGPRIGPIFLSNRGVAVPWGLPSDSFRAFLWVLVFGLGVAIGAGVVLTQQGKRTGRMPLVTLWGLVAFLGVGVIGWFALPQRPLTFDFPVLPETGFNVQGGKILSPEFIALLSGLVLYTAAFIGEVVRAGIQSVSKGQVEASRALGLSPFQTLRLVVFPQAMRVIVPPLTSQYLNLTKNSSLAIAIGYPDLVAVYGTISNQSGRAVEMTAIMMTTYLTISLLTSAFMNWYNKKIRLVER